MLCWFTSDVDMIDLSKVKRNLSNCHTAPVRVNLGNRPGELQIVLLIHSIVHDGNDLPLLQLHKGLIYFSDRVLGKLPFWLSNSLPSGDGFPQACQCVLSVISGYHKKNERYMAIANKYLYYF